MIQRGKFSERDNKYTQRVGWMLYKKSQESGSFVIPHGLRKQIGHCPEVALIISGTFTVQSKL